MRGFQPQENKQKTKGGPVRGPGTGTSDEVIDAVPKGTYIMPADSTQTIGEGALATMGNSELPVNLSNGEFKLPPEQVHAIGVQALDQMKDATHTPVGHRGFAPGGKPSQNGEPRMFFADGGVVDDEPKSRLVSVPSSMQRRENTTFNTDNSIATPAAPTAQPTIPTAAPVAPPQGMSNAQRQQAISQIPTGGVSAPAATTAPAATAPAPVAAPASQRPLGAQAASDRAKLGAAWDTVKDVNDDAGRAIADVAMLVPRGLAGAYDSTVIRPMRAAGIDAGYLSPHLVPNGVDPASMTPFTDQKRMQQVQTAATAAAPASQPPAAAPMDAPTAGAGRGTINPAVATPSAPKPTSIQPGATEIAPGVFRKGNSFADSAEGAIAGAQPRGLPSAQNNAAAEALAQRSQQGSVSRVLAGEQAAQASLGPQAPTVAHSGNDWRARETLRRMKMNAESLSNRDPRDRRQAQSAYQQAQAADFAAMTGGQAQADIEAMRQSTALTGEQMRQDGANTRASMHESAAGAREGRRAALDERRISLDEQVRGFDIRSGQRQENLYQQYEAAKTPEERAAVEQQIRAFSGKVDSPWRAIVTPTIKNADGSTSEGSVIRYNDRTGQVEKVDLGGRGLPPPKDSPQVQAIKNNTALTIEQRREELKKLGFT